MRYFSYSITLAIVFAVSILSIAAQPASSVRIRLEPYLSGLSSPLYATNAKDGTRRVFVVEQGGVIKVFQPNSTTAATFLDITSKIVSGGEQGLLGMAFHPQFATNGYFFVNYTRVSDGATIIARYKTTSGANAVGDPASERILLTIPQPFSNHNGGMIEFRVDNGVNNLYIGMGDGGSGNDPGNRAQNINELLGKFLRITPDVSGNNTLPAYTIPSDNPFVGVNGADEIYTVGMRNPFRWSFDRTTKELWAADVGQNAIEEVDIITRGGNYGWRVYEGNQCTNIDPALCIPANYIPPIFQYNNVGSPRCSVTGGYVYRGSRGSLPGGAYIYGDYCTGEIFIWNNQQQALLLDTTRNISSFGEDENGELFVVGLGGTVERIVRIDAPSDFDGDGRTDISVFRPSEGVWYILNSFNNSFRALQFGQNGDYPVPADYDGDNITDIAVNRNEGFWYYITSSDNVFRSRKYGFAFADDKPAPGDYDGDGKADLAFFRRGSGFRPATYFVSRSSDGVGTDTTIFGAPQAQGVPSDYDGDGKTDMASWDSSNGRWNILNSTNNAFSDIQFGATGDITAQGDYDGDGKSDLAVFRPSSGVWYIRQSTNGSSRAVQFGTSGDIPVVGDYDGDERSDVAVFRPSNGTWYYLRSSNGSFTGVQFGQNGDLPIPAYDNE